ncbi:uncharacterized protein V6R79_018594 [Siganus canaliculatus]
MKFVKYVLIFQLSYLCQAFQITPTQTRSPEVQATTKQEDFSSDPYVHRIAGKCSFTLKMSGNSSGDQVALTSNYTDLLVEQICRDLDCGGVYRVNKMISAPQTVCFHSCLHQDGRLQNCSQTEGSNCTIITEAVCGRQAVRLAAGSDRCAGRVELWRAGSWGTVCDDQWDLEDANVVCAQLGCGYALNVTGQNGPFPQGQGQIHLDELNCTGTEQNLWSCPSAREETDCGHKEDAGVVCSEMRAVRLTGGLDRCSGTVEIHRNGTWGTVCDNCWGENMADMVCSMLQCGPKALNFTRFNPPLPHKSGALWYYMCPAGSHSLWQCRESVNKRHWCKDSKASGVICNGSLGLPITASTNITVTPSWTTVSSPGESTMLVPVKEHSLQSVEFLSSIALCLLLLVFLITNTVLCCHYRKRHALLLQQRSSSQRPQSERPYNSYQDGVNLIKVTPNAPQTDDSQRYRTDANTLMKPSGLESLCEENAESQTHVMGAFTSCSTGPGDAQYARVSKISVDSFESSSTSSGECYENTNGFSKVTPEPGPSHSSVANGNNQFYSAASNEQGSGDDDDDGGPIYSPVSPDENTSSGDDYDDVGS